MGVLIHPCRQPGGWSRRVFAPALRPGLPERRGDSGPAPVGDWKHSVPPRRDAARLQQRAAPGVHGARLLQTVPGSAARNTSQLWHPAFPRPGRSVPSPSALAWAALREVLGRQAQGRPRNFELQLCSETGSLGNGSAEPGCGLARGEALNTKVGREPPCGAAAPPHYACIEKQTNKNISNAPPTRPASAPRASGLPAFSFLLSRAPFARPPSLSLRAAIGPACCC